MSGLAPLLYVLPILGFLFNAFVGRRFVEADAKSGEKWTGWLASVMALSSFAIALILVFDLSTTGYHSATVHLFEWIHVGDFYVPWAMQIDTLSATMLMVVTGVGSLIHIYAIGYMHGDKDFSRFFAYLNLFLFFMLILITGNNYLMLFVGWEGVGLCSFLLIGFWFSKEEVGKDGLTAGVANSNAARKAFVANRVGDLAMILAMSILFWAFASLEFDVVAERALDLFASNEMVHFGVLGLEFSVGTVLTFVTALFMMGAAGKSAQIPLYIWLPDAMAGPTPVSALIHAATMVTSGIYLIVRSNVLFEIVRVSDTYLIGSLTSNNLVSYIGAFTALFAGLIAFTQFDVKKVLAYSTVSQLGFMIAAVGMGAYVAGMFHLITHAFFKGLLFMGSGSIIHGMEHGHHHVHDHGSDHHDGHHPEGADDDFDPQDMRTMGNLHKHMPITSYTFHIGALALAGIPIFAGFWSKDEILAHASANGFTTIYILLALAAVCTAFYMGRQLKMVFHGEERHEAAEHAHESPWTMTTPLVILAVLSIIGGFVINLPFLSQGANEANHGHAGGAYLRLEGWLEHSIASFALSAEDGGDDHGEADDHAGADDDHATEDDHAGEDDHATDDEHVEDDAHAEADDHATDGDDHAEDDAHAEVDDHATDDGHGDGDDGHGMDDGHAVAGSDGHGTAGIIQTYGGKGLLHMPHTPVNLSYTVAIISTILAVAALAGSFFFVYGDKPKTAEEKDPLQDLPGWSFFAALPFNYVSMNILVPAFNRFANFAGITVDWDFYHDYFHNNIIRDGFVGISRMTSEILDLGLVDGLLVNGTAKLVGMTSSMLRRLKTGFVRNYAFGVFLGVVALLAYFVLAN